VAVVHQKPVPGATLESVRGEVQAQNLYDHPGNFIDFEAYVLGGGYSCCATASSTDAISRAC